MPKRFELTYADKDGKEKTPVMIHRAIIGSPERFMGILIEHYAGVFPLWLAPVQVVVIPVRDTHNDHAEMVFNLLKEANIRVEFDDADANLGTKVRNVKNNKIPYWVVIGEKEVKSNTITIESREGEKFEMAAEQFLTNIQEEIKERK